MEDDEEAEENYFEDIQKGRAKWGVRGKGEGETDHGEVGKRFSLSLGSWVSSGCGALGFKSSS